VLQFAPGINTAPHRIIAVTPDIDDLHVIPAHGHRLYPFQEGPIFGGRLFVHTDTNPYSLVTPVTRVIRDLSADQPSSTLPLSKMSARRCSRRTV